MIHLKLVHLQETVEDNGGVYFVPALTGLGAPYWDGYARGLLSASTQWYNRWSHCQSYFRRCCISGLRYCKAMEADAGTQSTELRVDGEHLPVTC